MFDRSVEHREDGARAASRADTVGASVGEVLRRRFGAQATLTVGSVDDPAEAEADAVADRVIARLMTGHTVDHGVTTPAVSRIARRSASRTGGPTAIGPDGGDVSVDTERRLASARSGGAPMPESTRSRMEGAFGADFSRVRLHTGSRSAQLNAEMGAKAFTIGRDIFLGANAPDLQRAPGERLLAHELAHTLQQGGSQHDGMQAARTIQRDADDAEIEETTESAETDEAEEMAESEPDDGQPVIAGELGEIGGEATPELSTAPPPGIQADYDGRGRPRPGRVASRSARSAPRSPSSRRLSIRVSDVATSSSAARSDSIARQPGGPADAVAAKVKTSNSLKGGLSTTPFGALSRWYKVKRSSWKAKGDTLTISVSIGQKLQWGVDGGTNKDIASGTSKHVTSNTYQDIVNDLTPVMNDKSPVAPRYSYWAKKLTIRHEKVHAKDVTEWWDANAEDLMKKSLEANTVDIDEDDEKADIEKKVAPIVEKARVAVQDASIVHMNGTGLTYYNYPTEIKAFGDGEQPYKDLAAAVKKQGETLEAAENKKAAKKKAG